MNDFAKLWIETLKSNRFRQNNSTHLCLINEEGDSYSYLGVACELYQEKFKNLNTESSQNIGMIRNGRQYYKTYDNHVFVLPKTVQRALGLNSCDLNCDNEDFHYVANFIETNINIFESKKDRVIRFFFDDYALVTGLALSVVVIALTHIFVSHSIK